MILKEAIITCHYRQIRLKNTSMDKAEKATFNFAVAFKVKAGLTAKDEKGNVYAKTISPKGEIENLITGGTVKYETPIEKERKNGHNRVVGAE